MNVSETIPSTLQELDPGPERIGAHWFSPAPMSVRQLSLAMKNCSARFVTITAYQLPRDEGLCLEYVWDLDGALLAFPFRLAAQSIETIYDICEAADWIEREVHEGFAIDFNGRAYEPLLLREGDRIGVNLREEVK
jgi:Respiratory-chain NADH dehydrogenase, 30 Kd subunit